MLVGTLSLFVIVPALFAQIPILEDAFSLTSRNSVLDSVEETMPFDGKFLSLVTTAFLWFVYLIETVIVSFHITELVVTPGQISGVEPQNEVGEVIQKAIKGLFLGGLITMVFGRSRQIRDRIDQAARHLIHDYHTLASEGDEGINKALAVINDRIGHSEDLQIQAVLALSLNAGHDNRALKELITIVENVDNWKGRWRVLLNAVKALGSVKNPEALSSLESLLRDVSTKAMKINAYVTAASLTSVAEIERESGTQVVSRELLASFLSEGYGKRVRSAAAICLGTLGELELLETALSKGPVEPLTGEAKKVIKRLLPNLALSLFTMVMTSIVWWLSI